MKKIFFSAAFLLFGFVIFSCNKNQTSKAFAFAIDSTSAINLSAGSSIIVQLPVSLVSGNTDSVTLTIIDLPNHITAVAPGGKPPFVSNMTFAADGGAIPGAYPITVTATSPNATAQSFEFVLNVVDCSFAMTGTYTVYADCATDTFTCNVTSTGTAHTINLGDFENTGVNARLLLNCYNDSLVINPQLIDADDSILSGYGSFTGNRIMFSYVRKKMSLDSTVSCSQTLFKQ